MGRDMPSAFPNARLLTWLSYGAMMSLSIGINLLPVFLTTLSRLYGGEEGLSQEQLGRLGASVFGGLVIGIVITGPLADRFGAKPFALLGNLFIAVSLVGMALAPSYALLGVTFFFLGLGSGILDMILSPIVAALNPDKLASSMNLLHSFYCVGAIVTVMIGTLALGFDLGWAGACYLLLPLPLVLLTAFSLLRFPSLIAEGGRRMPLRQLLRRRWFGLALIAIFLGGATELGIAQWLPAYAEISLGYSTEFAGLCLLLFSLAMSLGRMIIGAIGNRVTPITLMVWSCSSSVVLFIIGCFFPVPWVALTACILVGFTGSCLWPTTLAITANHYPNGGASMFALLAALGNAGGIFMPWVVGAVADLSSLSWGISVSLLAPLLMLPLLRAMRKHPT
ncbi:MFS transporter [Ruficoccus amylovorans]|uniref:MFS transporter n=2 Tax=Ruficoccus amylovorans TaxID=1804625 RepID=A0A842HE81_9BACT|nr:MFS transporter [Ruficoccus amylovorans]